MNKKLKISAIIFALILCGVLLIGSLNAFSFGDSEMKLPDGFYKGEDNKNGDMNITNGNVTLFLKEINASDINESVASYEKHCAKNNYSIVKENIHLNNVDVYKITEAKTEASHYWFEHNGKGYSIYSWKKVDNSDKIVSDIISKL